MMQNNMHTIDTAACNSRSHHYEPARKESETLRIGFYCTTACMILGALFLTLF